MSPRHYNCTYEGGFISKHEVPQASLLCVNVSVLFYFIFVFSPNKTEFIKAKYQMLAYVHRMPCREDDSVTAKDLSKVSKTLYMNGLAWLYK